MHFKNLKLLMSLIRDLGNNSKRVIVKLSRRVRSQYFRLDDSAEDTVQK